MLPQSKIGPPAGISVVETRLAISGGELYRRRAGGGTRAGATIIVVHGGPGLSHEPLLALEVLATPDRCVVNYDQRGVGRSSGGMDEADFVSQALGDLDAIRIAAGGDRVHLVGHARGALLAALYAGTHPDRVDSLALIDSFPPTAQELAAACERQASRVRDFQRRGLIPTDLPSLEEDGVGCLLAILPAFFVDPRHPAARSLAGASFSLPAFRASRSALRSYDVRAIVGNVRVPSLHIIASVPFGSQMASAMAAAMGGSIRRVVLRDAGHLAWLEQPERVFSELASFVDDIDQTQPGGYP